MKCIRLFLTACAVLTAMSFAAAAQSSIEGALKVAEAGSCQGWYATCVSRCSSQKKLNCDQAFCSGKLDSCRQSGCFIEGKSFGNKVHCGLAK